MSEKGRKKSASKRENGMMKMIFILSFVTTMMLMMRMERIKRIGVRGEYEVWTWWTPPFLLFFYIGLFIQTQSSIPHVFVSSKVWNEERREWESDDPLQFEWQDSVKTEFISFSTFSLPLSLILFPSSSLFSLSLSFLTKKRKTQGVM